MEIRQADRRPIPARQTPWASAVAGWLARAGVQPNQVSVFGVVVAALAGACIVIGARSGTGWHMALFVTAAALIPLRLLCNLFDGMLAVEMGLQTRSGMVYNDLPDRVADAVILVCAGYAITGIEWGRDLGWATGLLAVMTAYVRLLGGASGTTQDFSGPMAKQQRMAVIALACLLAAAGVRWGWSDRVLITALGVVIAGCVVTVARRTLHIIRELESR